MRSFGTGVVSLISALVFLVPGPGAVLAAEAQEAPAVPEKPREKSTRYDKDALHRLDLRIVGKSCPVCLLGIKKKLNALPGVVKADVMLKRPYGASVVYDAKQVQQAKIIEVIQSYEKNTLVEGVVDAPIDKVPLVLVPPIGASPPGK
jgi:copper chaperone CopZ